MAVKRKAAEAFSNKASIVDQQSVAPPLSAFAAAKARRAAAAAEVQQVQIVAEVEPESSEADAALDSAYDSPLNSDFEDERLQASSLPAQPVHKNAFSSTNLKVRRAAQDASDISIPQDSYVTVLGEYSLSVLAGSVSICGGTFYPSQPCLVYGYTSHAVPQITSTAADTIVRISPLAIQSQKLAVLSPSFRNISGPARDSPSYLIVDADNQGLLPRSATILDTSPDYQTVLAKLAMKWQTEGHNLTVACIGGKSTGKSTFAKHIINKLLTKTTTKSCYYLDLDPGQPEYGPAGQIYLVEVFAPVLGPPYTHFAAKQNPAYRLVAAQTIAALSFKDAPGYYMDCVKSLFANRQLLAARQSGCPVVVNTCGWTKDLGARVLADILDHNITDSVIINHVDATVVAAARTKCQDVYQLERTLLDQVSTRQPREYRQMQTMAYMHSLDLHKQALVDWASRPVSQWRPWLVDFASDAGITAVASYGQPIAPQFLAEVLNGSLAAIVTTEEDFGEEELEHTPEGIPYLRADRLLNPQHCQYHSLALLRGIDAESKQLQLITPLEEASIGTLMQKTVVLVRGAFDSPDWAYLSDIHYEDEAASVARPWVTQQTLYGIAAAVWRQRRAPTKNTRG